MASGSEGYKKINDAKKRQGSNISSRTPASGRSPQRRQ